MPITLADEGHTIALGEALGRALAGACRERPAWQVWLVGPLGAGKTTLARGVLRALGHAGPVRSPTYTLVEPYDLACCMTYHLDLYRLADPEELELLGIRDELAGPAIVIVEWPERGALGAVRPDLRVELAHDGDVRTARIEGLGTRGAALKRAIEGERDADN